ncbi:Spy/CpxP family protein refolding chaperone [Fundidesulfovibrio agrisoli]|uniref:Spy/CpxP family protein refolding chaperone n=1 Tax=Fundidesulfovibrio agrisoli TaxID=2922717 RepID=UPI001FABB6DE|nr:Spy/CpxP family protein refolding chaperone [Fundidesulfovibrio agrisoli]
MNHSTRTITLRPLAAALPLVAALLLCLAPAARAQDQAPSAPQTQPQAKSQAKPKGQRGGYNNPEAVEERIAELRAKLAITPAQEAAWDDLAKVMRDNGAKMRASIDKWREQRASLNAVENLKLHAGMAEEHAQAMRGLIPVFEKLYNMLSPEQKKVADESFSQRMGRGKKKGS